MCVPPEHSRPPRPAQGAAARVPQLRRLVAPAPRSRLCCSRASLDTRLRDRVMGRKKKAQQERSDRARAAQRHRVSWPKYSADYKRAAAARAGCARNSAQQKGSRTAGAASPQAAPLGPATALFPPVPTTPDVVDVSGMRCSCCKEAYGRGGTWFAKGCTPTAWDLCTHCLDLLADVKTHLKGT
jgi:hypothetical protein